MTDHQSIVDEAVATMATAQSMILRLRATVSIMDSTLEAVREHLVAYISGAGEYDDRAKPLLALVEEAIQAGKRAP